MPNISDHQSAKTTKMLLVGDNGSGKTGALASLAQAGYNIRLLDIDNGADVLANTLLSPNSPYGKDAAKHVEFETLTDPMKKSPSGKLIPAKATVWQRSIDLLNHWKTTNKAGVVTDLGPLTSWTEQDVLAIDSLTMLCLAAMNFVLSMNARLGQAPHQSDWYTGQQMVESLMQMLFDDSIKCNVVIMCHIAYIGEENGPLKGYPATLGKALSPKIGSYFNSVLLCKTSGTGVNQKRKILTNTAGLIELKNSNPFKVKPEYDQSTGLAEYFRDVRSGPQ